MISIAKYKKLTWINLESPTSEDIKLLVTKYKVHPIAAEELLKPTIRSRVDSYKNFIFFVFHFPIYNTVTHVSASTEIDFIIGKNIIVTTHYKTITPLHEMIKKFEAESVLRENNTAESTEMLMFNILRRLYIFSLRQIDHIQEKIDLIEEKIFSKNVGPEHEMVEEISLAKRDVLDFRRVIRPHRDVLKSLEIAGNKLLDKEFSNYINNIIGDYFRIWNLLENHKETMDSLQDSHDSLLSHKTNEIMRTLTIISFITFPLMIISSIFGMNTDTNFWFIVGIMALATTIMFLFFKYKKWL